MNGRARVAVKGKLFNSTELTLRNCSRRRAPACFTKRQINLGTRVCIYIYNVLYTLDFGCGANLKTPSTWLCSALAGENVGDR